PRWKSTESLTNELRSRAMQETIGCLAFAVLLQRSVTVSGLNVPLFVARRRFPPHVAHLATWYNQCRPAVGWRSCFGILANRRACSSGVMIGSHTWTGRPRSRSSRRVVGSIWWPTTLGWVRMLLMPVADHADGAGLGRCEVCMRGG